MQGTLRLQEEQHALMGPLAPGHTELWEPHSYSASRFRSTAANEKVTESHTGLPRDTPAPRVPGCVPKNPKKKPEDSSLALSQELKPANTVPLLSSTQVPSISFIRADRHLNTTALLAKHLCSPWTNQLPFTNCWQDQHCRRELPVFHQDPTKLGFRQGSTAFASVTKPGSQGIGAE